MNVDSIVIYNGLDQIELNLNVASTSNPYILAGASGLDPDELVSSYYSQSLQSSSQKFYNMSLKKRTVSLKLALNPNYKSNQSYSSLRDRLYRFISATRESFVEIRFLNQGLITGLLKGRVIRLESDLMNKNQTVTISIDCEYPIIRSQNRVSVSTSILNGSKAISNITDNLSTAPHGFLFSISITGPVLQSYRFVDLYEKWLFRLDYQLLTGDTLEVCTEEDNRYARVIRSGIRTNLIDKMSTDSVWPVMFPGLNEFAYNITNYTWNEFSYYTSYWGI